MAGKVLEFDLQYTDENGVEKIFPVTIRNSYAFYIRDYPEINNVVDKLKGLNEEIIQCNVAIGASSDKKEIEVLEEKIREIEKKIEAFSVDSLISKRADLIIKLLKKNGYADNEMLMSRDFWFDDVIYSSMNELMLEVYYKDSDKKKVLSMLEKFST